MAYGSKRYHIAQTFHTEKSRFPPLGAESIVRTAGTTSGILFTLQSRSWGSGKAVSGQKECGPHERDCRAKKPLIVPLVRKY